MHIGKVHVEIMEYKRILSAEEEIYDLSADEKH